METNTKVKTKYIIKIEEEIIKAYESYLEAETDAEFLRVVYVGDEGLVTIEEVRE